MIETQVHRGLQDILDTYMCGDLGEKNLWDISVAELWKTAQMGKTKQKKHQQKQKNKVLTKIGVFCL